jgi:hypothetical protein
MSGLKRYLVAAAAVLGMGAVAAGLLGGIVAASADPGTVLQFRSMAAVTGPFVGSANPVRGLNGGGFPWVISSGMGKLQPDGDLKVRVRGLVLANDPAVPAALRLTNPIPQFKAVVSCLTIGTAGTPAVTNVSTAGFPASPQGDADIEAHVALPQHCFAPIVFVTSPTGAWFATTGF